MILYQVAYTSGFNILSITKLNITAVSKSDIDYLLIYGSRFIKRVDDAPNTYNIAYAHYDTLVSSHHSKSSSGHDNIFKDKLILAIKKFKLTEFLS